MIKILKNCDVYAPERLNRRDILIIGSSIMRIDESITDYDSCADAEIMNMRGKTVIPGYIDLHSHIIGGGGEMGFASRVPESAVSHFLLSGVTTVVGLLGTDGVTRSLESLLAKTRALKQEGVTAFMLTGSYAYPSVSLTGGVERDLVLIDEIIGVKVAISDRRDSSPTCNDLRYLAAQAHRGGLLSGSAGLTVMHVGDGKDGIKLLFQLLESSDIPIKNLLPTHIGRSPGLRRQGLEFIKMGGTADITAGHGEKGREACVTKITEMLDAGADIKQITISSDSYGSLPKFDQKGRCVSMKWGFPSVLHDMVKSMVNANLPLEQALMPVTANPARVLCLDGVKGRLQMGADADIVVLDDDLSINMVFSKGRLAVSDNHVLFNRFFE